MKLSVHNNTEPLLAALLATSLLMSKVWSAEDIDNSTGETTSGVNGSDTPDWEMIHDILPVSKSSYGFNNENYENFKQECFNHDGVWEAVPDQTHECISLGGKRTKEVTTTTFGGCLIDLDECEKKYFSCSSLQLAFTEKMKNEGWDCKDFIVSTETGAPEVPWYMKKENVTGDATDDATDDQESAAPLIGVFTSASIAVGMAGVAMIL